MLQDIERLQLAALLHDIGKFRQRTIATRPFRPHERHGWEFVTEDFGGFFHPCGDDLGDAILNHHNFPRQTKEIEKQVTLADRLSAKERETEQRDQEKPSHAALVSIMSRLQIPDKPQPPELRYDLNPLDIRRETIFPTEDGSVDPNRYEELWGEFTRELQLLTGERGYQSADYQTLVALLHKYTARMPSATPWEGGASGLSPMFRSTTTSARRRRSRRVSIGKFYPMIWTAISANPPNVRCVPCSRATFQDSKISSTELSLKAHRGNCAGGRSTYNC